MISMDGVPSALVARHSSWVRQEAAALSRRLPSNVERADLIQVGLIAVAQASLAFEWEGDPQGDEAREAFVRYARQRVRGAMLDELRSMDVLPRGQRRQIKVIEVARERWQARHGREPTLAELAEVCALDVDEVARLELAAEHARAEHLPGAGAGDDGDAVPHLAREPATAHDEVEARVETGLLLRRLEGYFAQLPEVERRVIDAYLGVGLSPVQLAASLNVSASRVAQIYSGVCRRIAVHLGHAAPRAAERVAGGQAALERRIADRDAGTRGRRPAAGDWSARLARVLASPPAGEPPLVVGADTRWG